MPEQSGFVRRTVSVGGVVAPLSTKPLPQPRTSTHWYFRYSLAIVIVGVATVLRLAVDPWVHDQIPYFIYIGSVVVATWFCGIDGGILGVVVAGFVGNYLFVQPRYDWSPEGEDWLAMGLFAAVGFALVALVGRWKRAERSLYAQAYRLQEQAEELRAVNRLKDEFLATLSHELRTPLSAILGWAQILDTGHLDIEQQKHATETIVRNARAQARLVEDVLDVSGIVSGKLALHLAAVDLAAVVQSAIDMVRPAADAKKIDVRTSFVPHAVMVGDGDRLRQISWNLLSNAVKFTGKGGVVDVKVEGRESQLVLTVADTGSGIDPEFLPHLFERFRQADSSTTRRHGGLGLGLAIVRHLAELHGGTVTARSPGPERGATFTVAFPVRAVAEAAPVQAGIGREDEQGAPPTPTPALQRIKVLVVDDEGDARELVQAVLAQYGAEVRAASSAQEGFQELRDWQPDVLVADIGMPDEDGYSLIRRVRRLSAIEGGSIPAAALTAYAQAADRERALSSGFQEHVAKPVQPERLAEVVARLAKRDASRRLN
jgi:signal transduction histidine kinase/ActR/RegA family two-component response regulator